MITVISPSKTMQASSTNTEQPPRLLDAAAPLLDALKSMNFKQIQSTFKLSESLTKSTLELYADFTQKHRAIKAYTGPQFQALDAASLDKPAVDYLNKHVYIISGLYGLVRPNDTIGLYRLPMGEKLNNKPLQAYWRPKIKPVLEGKTVLNLASGEYASALSKDLDVYHVAFDQAPGVHIKRLRGRMVRQLATHAITNVSDIKNLVIDEYAFSHYDELIKTFVFIKEKK